MKPSAASGTNCPLPPPSPPPEVVPRVSFLPQKILQRTKNQEPSPLKVDAETVRRETPSKRPLISHLKTGGSGVRVHGIAERQFPGICITAEQQICNKKAMITPERIEQDLREEAEEAERCENKECNTKNDNEQCAHCFMPIRPLTDAMENLCYAKCPENHEDDSLYNFANYMEKHFNLDAESAQKTLSDFHESSSFMPMSSSKARVQAAHFAVATTITLDCKSCATKENIAV